MVVNCTMIMHVPLMKYFYCKPISRSIRRLIQSPFIIVFKFGKGEGKFNNKLNTRYIWTMCYFLFRVRMLAPFFSFYQSLLPEKSQRNIQQSWRINPSRMTLKVYKLLTLIGPTSPSFTDFSCSFVRRKQLLLLSSLSSKKKEREKRSCLEISFILRKEHIATNREKKYSLIINTSL